MRMELLESDYQKIRASLQRIENMAWGGVFSIKEATTTLYKIGAEARTVRQALHGALPAKPVQGEGGAA